MFAIPTAGIVTRSAGVNPARGEVPIRGEVVRRDASALMMVSTGRGIPAENFTLEPAAIRSNYILIALYGIYPAISA